MIDPDQNLNAPLTVLVSDGLIAGMPNSTEQLSEKWHRINVTGTIICPGFVDLHTHLRQPGEEWKETIATGTRAAAAGGFTTVCAMPNTIPPVDSGLVLKQVMDLARSEGLVKVLPIATITKERAGAVVAPLAQLAEAGAVGFSDDGDCVARPSVMQRALQYAARLSVPIINHAEDKDLVNGGVVNEGTVSNRLGLRGASTESEAIVVARDILLAAVSGAHLHVPHVSTATTVELIREAKRRGIHVTAEATPHHLTLTDAWVIGERGTVSQVTGIYAYDQNTRVNPPLRSEEDKSAVVAGLQDGTIDAIATDHAPHGLLDKERVFDEASPGISGLETAFGLTASLVHNKTLDLPSLIACFTSNPARIIGRASGTLKVGRAADIVCVNLHEEWQVNADQFVSSGHNTPLHGETLKGKVKLTLVDGKIVHKNGIHEA